jgi:CBS domain-containing protein
MPTSCPSCGYHNIEGTDECAHCGADLTDLDVPRPQTAVEAVLMKRTIASLNLAPPRTIYSDQPLEEAVRIFADEGRVLLSVIDRETRKLVGVLSVRDLVTQIGARYEAALRRCVGDFMTPRPETLPPDAPVAFALNKMDVGGYRHVPVLDPQTEQLVGLCGTKDVMSLITKTRPGLQ